MRLQRIGKNARLAAAIAMTLFSASVSTVYALPTGEQIQSGMAKFTRGEASLDIEQKTDRVAIDWTSFDIAANEKVNFVQPNANSIALNRVTGNDVSEIYGALNANGKVFLLNPHGILFADGASINVGGLVASTGDLKDRNNTNNPLVMADFANGEDFVIECRNQGEILGSVVNHAAINAKINDEGGLVVFQARTIKNEGTIETGKGGIVQLDAVKKLNVNYDGGKINFTVDDFSG